MVRTSITKKKNYQKSSLIIHIVTTIDLGGAEKQLLILVDEQLKRGLKVMIIPLKGKNTLEKDFLDLGCLVYSKITNQSFFRQTHHIKKLLEKQRDFIVHAHLPRAEIISILVSNKPTKLIISRHNTEQFFPRIPQFVSSLISRYVLKKADAIIAISNAVRNYLLMSGEAKNSISIWVVPYGIQIKLVKSTRVEKTDVENTTYQIGTIARLVKQKNLETLIKSFSKYQFRYPDSKLVIIGEGDQDTYLFDLANDLSISESVIWMKSVKNVAEVLKSIDLFVLPSLYEGFGLVYLEAMLANIPIISSNNQSALEIFGIDAENLFVMKNVDSLVSKMLEFRAPNKVKKIVKRYPIILSRYSAKNMEKKLFAIYFPD